MITLKSGTQTEGLWKLYLKSKHAIGFTIRCYGEHRNYTFNNVHDFRWIYEGSVVFMKSHYHEYQTIAYDLSGWNEVTIEHSTEISDRLLTIEKLD